MKKKDIILQYGISLSAKAGVYVLNMELGMTHKAHDTHNPHRDNHYLLMIATNGRYKISLDFNEIVIESPALLLVSPGQVHHLLDMVEPKGWALSFEPELLDADLQQLMENGLSTFMNLDTKSKFCNRLFNVLSLMEDLQSGIPDNGTSKAIQLLLGTLFQIIAGKLVNSNAEKRVIEGRSFEIERSFAQLLKKHFKEWKQPADYAAELSISVAHLNDCVKRISGKPVSLHIQLYAILEAKRLLYYTDLSVKEIGYKLGYHEPVYFGKLFKKITGFTALQFRQLIHI